MMSILSNNIKITCEDNMVLMKRYPDKHFDLAIVDPPYGINAPNLKMGSNPTRQKVLGSGPAISTAERLRKGRLNSGGGTLKKRLLNQSDCSWDGSPPDSAYFEELMRVSKNQVIFGGNYFSLPPTRGIIFWDKMQPWENFSQFELAWTSFDKPAAKIAISNTGGANLELRIHPTQKPVDLYKWILTKYANKGDKILDTHYGSGSIGLACYDYGFDLTACELDEKYYQESLTRLNSYMSQLKIF